MVKRLRVTFFVVVSVVVVTAIIYQPRMGIEHENLDQSIEGLIRDDHQYFHPGFHSGRKFAQLNLEVMLNTRRSIKVLEALNKLPISKQVSKCKEMFATAYKAHTNAFWLLLNRIENPSLPLNANSTMATQ